MEPPFGADFCAISFNFYLIFFPKLFVKKKGKKEFGHIPTQSQGQRDSRKVLRVCPVLVYEALSY